MVLQSVKETSIDEKGARNQIDEAHDIKDGQEESIAQ